MVADEEKQKNVVGGAAACFVADTRKRRPLTAAG